MTDTIQNTILPMTDTTVTPEDYTGEDGLLYCGKCHKPKEAYFPEGKTFFGRTAIPIPRMIPAIPGSVSVISNQ